MTNRDRIATIGASVGRRRSGPLGYDARAVARRASKLCEMRREGAMQGRFWLMTGSLLAALDVALAAYGAHGLRETLDRIVPQETPVGQAAGFKL